MINFKSLSIKNFFYLFCDKFLASIINFFVLIYIARYLGPENFGILSYAYSIIAIVFSLSSLGLEQIIIKDLINFKSKTFEIVGTALFARITVTVILIILWSIISISVVDRIVYYLGIIISLNYLFLSFDIIDYFFQSVSKFKLKTIARISGILISASFKLLFIYLHLDLVFFGFIYILDALFVSFFYIYFFRKEGFELYKIKINFEYLIGSSKKALPLLLSTLIIIIYMRTDQIMIKQFLDSNSVGYYTAALKISEIWYFFPVAIGQIIYPNLIKFKEEAESKYKKYLQKVYDLMIYISLPVALLFTFLSDSVINFIYGTDYLEANSVLSIHIWSSLFVFVGIISTRWLVIENLQRYTFVRSVIGVVVNIGLNFALIPKFGISGAAIATLISQIFASYLSYLFSSNTFIAFKMISKSLLMLNLFKKTNV